MSHRSQVDSAVSSPSEAQSHGPGGVRALRPLAGAGLAALLSIELVVADAVLGNQVAPAEVVHAVFLCRDTNNKEQLQQQIKLRLQLMIVICGSLQSH